MFNFVQKSWTFTQFCRQNWVKSYNKYGVLRSRTRLELSETLPYNTRFPIILPAKSPTVEKLILFLHVLQLHAKTNFMSAYIRQKYILMKNIRELKRILNKCLTPRCNVPPTMSQQMSPLPSSRLDTPRCWDIIACDLLGPMFVKVFQDNIVSYKKCWVALYTCLVSRSVSLELMLDQSTLEFMNSFRIMCSRRGNPTTIYSDNGSYFTLANKELRLLYKTINWAKVNDDSLKHNITWIFSAPSQPWAQACAERLVASVKKPLKTIIGTAKLTLRQLQVVIAEIEMVINSRPLTVVSPESLIPISPNELIFGRKLVNLPMQPKTDSEMKLIDLWKKRKTIMFAFWKSWRNTYLMGLSLRKKWTDLNTANLVGKVVLIQDPNLSSGEWRLAQITKVFPSKNDQQIRSVELRTATGILIRPVQRLSLLEYV